MFLIYIVAAMLTITMNLAHKKYIYNYGPKANHVVINTLSTHIKNTLHSILVFSFIEYLASLN